MVYWRVILPEAFRHLWGGLNTWFTLVSLVVIPVPPLAQYFPKQTKMIADWLSTLPWWSGLLPIGILLLIALFKADLHQHSRSQGEIRQLRESLQPRLVVSLETEPVPTGNNTPYEKRAWFWRLRIINSGYSPVARCYGAMQHCLRITEEGKKLDNDHAWWPKGVIRLPWARHSRGANETWYEVDIGGSEQVYLDYLMAYYASPTDLHVPARPDTDEQRPEYHTFALAGVYKYEFEIAVGSKVDSSGQSVIRFLFELNGRGRATLTELYNSSPQVAGREGSPT